MTSVTENTPSIFIDRLQESSFFGPLSDGTFNLLATQARQTHYSSGATVFGEGQPSKGLYWLQFGTLKAVKYSESGREVVLHLIEPGRTFNEVGAFSALPNPASVVALETSKVWRIPGEAIRHAIQEDPILAQRVIDVLSQRLRHAVELVEDLSLRPVINRLARLILDEAQGDTLFRPAWYTQSELAARLGTVADVLQRALRKLEADDLIETDRKQILILNRAALEEVAG